jgi:hypothetical protein
MSVSLSWCQAPIWGLRPDFYYCQTVAGLLMWGTLSDVRTGLSFTTAVALTSAVILRSESRGTHVRILMSQIRDSPNLEGQVPLFISGVARLFTQALGSLFVASYDSQGYVVGIRTRLQARKPPFFRSSLPFTHASLASLPLSSHLFYLSILPPFLSPILAVARWGFPKHG